MTSTGNEPVEDPQMVPAGDAGVEHAPDSGDDDSEDGVR